MKFKIFIFIFLAFISNLSLSYAAGNINLYVKYPYSMDGKGDVNTYQNSTAPFYINLENYNNNLEQNVDVEISLPFGLIAEESPGWQSIKTDTGLLLRKKFDLPSYYGQTFNLLYLHSSNELALGEQIIQVKATSADWEDKKVLSFIQNKPLNLNDKIEDKKQDIAVDGKFNWYIQSVVFPVDNFGKKDERAQENILYIKDMALEGFRNRIMGEGATNWSAVFNHPSAYLSLDMRNPQQDIRTLKFKVELIDKNTGKIIPGFSRVSASDNEAGQGWSDSNVDVSQYATTAMISLDGFKNQAFILPIYTDSFKILAGDYKMRVTVSGGGAEKIYESPLKIVKERNLSVFALGFAGACLGILLFSFKRINNCIKTIGAKGAITISLFAAVAFGGIVLPTTLLGDFFQVILGPFSGLITGLLSGVLQYLLIVTLLMLYRKPGVITLMFLLKWLLAGLIFGRFTPLGILTYAVQIVVMEAVLYISGFYSKQKINLPYMLLIACLLGISDAFITMINMEQMMFFYRLYYADWYIGLYMLVNGMIYSSIGSVLGYRIGSKLQQVMGE